jgi:hypothetical protein
MKRSIGPGCADKVVSDKSWFCNMVTIRVLQNWNRSPCGRAFPTWQRFSTNCRSTHDDDNGNECSDANHDPTDHSETRIGNDSFARTIRQVFDIVLERRFYAAVNLVFYPLALVRISVMELKPQKTDARWQCGLTGDILHKLVYKLIATFPFPSIFKVFHLIEAEIDLVRRLSQIRKANATAERVEVFCSHWTDIIEYHSACSLSFWQSLEFPRRWWCRNMLPWWPDGGWHKSFIVVWIVKYLASGEFRGCRWMNIRFHLLYFFKAKFLVRKSAVSRTIRMKIERRPFVGRTPSHKNRDPN